LEWSGRQQLLFLVQSAGLGVLIGLVFDIITGVTRGACRRLRVFLLDVLFGVLAALITFFGTLAIMDGQLHPLLFVGALIGFLSEHGSVGRWISRGVCRCQRCFSRAGLFLLDRGERFLLRLAAVFSKKKLEKPIVKKTDEKKRKKSRFFAKKA